MVALLARRIGNASLGWYFRQLLPLSYWSVNERCTGHEIGTGVDCHKTLVLWRMWFGRCFNTTMVPLD